MLTIQDHIHLSVAIPPKISIANFMGYLKGKSTLMLYDRHPELQSKWDKAFWARDQLWKVNHKLAENFFFISVVKKGNFNRAPLGCFFKIYRYWYTDLLFEVKFYFVSEHLPDDSDKFAGTVPKCIVMRPAFSPLGIIISLEGCVVSDNVPSCIYKGIS